MAFCIAGHHAGLANGNSEGDNRRTLKDRLALQFGADIPTLDNLWQQEIKLSQNLSAPPLKADKHHPFNLSKISDNGLPRLQSKPKPKNAMPP